MTAFVRPGAVLSGVRVLVVWAPEVGTRDEGAGLSHVGSGS